MSPHSKKSLLLCLSSALYPCMQPSTLFIASQITPRPRPRQPGMSILPVYSSQSPSVCYQIFYLSKKKKVCYQIFQHLEDMYCRTSTCTSRITSSKLHCWTSKIETLKGLMWRLNTITRQQAQKNNSRITTMRWSIAGKPSTCTLIVEYINEARQSLEKNKPYVKRNSILTQWIRPQEGSTQIWTES